MRDNAEVLKGTTTPDPLLRLHAVDIRRKGYDAERERGFIENDILTCQAELSRYAVIEKRKHLASLHPLLFGRIYFPDWMPRETPDFHWEIADGYMNLSRLGVAAPVGSAKTTILTKLCNLWSAFFEDWCWDQLIISSSGDLVSTWIDDMGRQCSTSAELKEDFGEFKGTHWGSDTLEFLIKDSKGKMRSSFIRGLGRSAALRGRRPDRITVDDPEDEESLKTDRQRDDFRSWMRGPLINRLDEVYKKLTYIGTCVTPDCYLVSIINNPPDGWVVRSYAMLNEATNESLWPDKYPLSFLQQRRAEIGEERFQSEFQNNPVRNWHQALFHINKIKVMEKELKSTDLLTMCVDPSFARGGDPWGITVVGVDEKADWHLHEAKKAKTGTEGLLQAIYETWMKYRMFQTVGVETGGGQKAFEYTLEQYCREKGMVLPLQYLNHTWNKGRKSSRIAGATSLLNSGRLTVDPGARAFLQEAEMYRTGVESQEDHLLDSFVMHLEVQNPRRPRIIETPTPEELRKIRFQNYEKVWARNKAKTSHWDRYV